MKSYHEKGGHGSIHSSDFNDSHSCTHKALAWASIPFQGCAPKIQFGKLGNQLMRELSALPIVCNDWSYFPLLQACNMHFHAKICMPADALQSCPEESIVPELQQISSAPSVMISSARHTEQSSLTDDLRQVITEMGRHAMPMHACIPITGLNHRWVEQNNSDVFVKAVHLRIVL